MAGATEGLSYEIFLGKDVPAADAADKHNDVHEGLPVEEPPLRPDSCWVMGCVFTIAGSLALALASVLPVALTTCSDWDGGGGGGGINTAGLFVLAGVTAVPSFGALIMLGGLFWGQRRRAPVRWCRGLLIATYATLAGGVLLAYVTYKVRSRRCDESWRNVTGGWLVYMILASGVSPFLALLVAASRYKEPGKAVLL